MRPGVAISPIAGMIAAEKSVHAGARGRLAMHHAMDAAQKIGVGFTRPQAVFAPCAMAVRLAIKCAFRVVAANLAGIRRGKVTDHASFEEAMRPLTPHFPARRFGICMRPFFEALHQSVTTHDRLLFKLACVCWICWKCLDYLLCFLLFLRSSRICMRALCIGRAASQACQQQASEGRQKRQMAIHTLASRLSASLVIKRKPAASSSRIPAG